jgi:hypothetical protein
MAFCMATNEDILRQHREYLAQQASRDSKPTGLGNGPYEPQRDQSPKQEDRR